MKGNRLLEALRYGFLTLPRDLAHNLLLGLLLAALFSVFIPAHSLPENIGHGIIGYLSLLALGIPLYVCATGSVPMVLPLLAKGIISPGAALVFLVSGPATNLASIVTLWKILGRRTSIVYLVTVAGLALLSGFIMDSLLPPMEFTAFSHQHLEDASLLHHLSAAALLAMLLAAMLPPRAASPAAQATLPEGAETAVLEVHGMTCSHCTSSVERALAEQPGVSSVSVDLRSGTATASGRGLDQAALVQVVDSLGFRARLRS